MAQVDQTSVGGQPGQGQDMKVSCETMACWDDDNNEKVAEAVEYAYAPESFWVAKDAELDWLDRNAYLDRKDSGKATSSGSGNPAVSATSQRYSKTNTKASLLALPKPQKQNYALLKNRQQGGSLFPKRSEPKPNPVLSINEPGSPKVSCMGRVRSRKDSRRSKKPQPPAAPPPSLLRNRSGVGVKHRKSGFWNNFRSMFRSKGRSKPPVNVNDNHQTTSNGNSNKRAFQSDDCSHTNDIMSCQPPTLGGMKRFASGRKSDGWAGDVVQVLDGSISEPHPGPIWRRREVDVDPSLLHVQRDWRTVGPLSV